MDVDGGGVRMVGQALEMGLKLVEGWGEVSFNPISSASIIFAEPGDLITKGP